MVAVDKRLYLQKKTLTVFDDYERKQKEGIFGAQICFGHFRFWGVFYKTKTR